MKTILVIDDSEVNLYLIQTIFENEKDITVHIESDSKIAFARVENEKPDVVILDLMMPYIDGFKLLKTLKGNPNTKDIPVLVVSARQDQKAFDETMKLGGVGYIKKPIVPSEVVEKVQIAMLSSNK